MPSVGMDPCKFWYVISFEVYERRLTPTALPRKKRRIQSERNEVAKEAIRPNIAVKNNVALKAVLRPMRSEP